MAALGHSPHVVERVLNHISGVNSGLVRVYQRHPYGAERRAALLGWSERVMALVGSTDSDAKVSAIPEPRG